MTVSGTSGTLFQAGASFVHAAHPTTKLLYAVVTIACSLVVTRLPFLAALALSVCVVLYLAGVWRAFLRATARYLVLLTFFLLVIQGLFREGPSAVLLQIGPASLKTAGVLFAASMVLRIFTMVGAFLVVVLTTHPADLVQAIEQAGASPRVGYLLLATLQLSPEMVERARRIIDAQRSRGLRTDGSLVMRFRGLVPLVGPLFYGSLMSVEAKAMALTARGFFTQRRKTWVRTLAHQPWEPAARIALGAVFVGVVVLRVLGWA
ncbi:MAG: energy-coupling factor transporter transmembrane component T [Chloroflexi bacterium]|nr:energy-coupling factor transporter transmembrane component T [Chloroflexota bacterium]